MRRKTGGGVSPRSRAALKAAKAGSSVSSNFCSTAIESRRSCRRGRDHLPGSPLPLVRRLLVARPDSDVDAEHDDHEIDRDSEPVVRAEMCGNAAGAHVEPFSTKRLAHARRRRRCLFAQEQRVTLQESSIRSGGVPLTGESSDGATLLARIMRTTINEPEGAGRSPPIRGSRRRPLRICHPSARSRRRDRSAAPSCAP